METIRQIIADLINGEKSISYRFANLIVIIVVILLVDYSLKFTYNIFQSHKLGQLESIVLLKKEYKDDRCKLKELDKLNESILANRHYYEIITDYFDKRRALNDEEIKKNGAVKLNVYYTALSSSLGFIIFIFLSFTRPIWRWDFAVKKNVETYAVAILLSISVAVYTVLLMKVPILFESWVNYTLYFLLHMATVYFMFFSKKGRTVAS